MIALCVRQLRRRAIEPARAAMLHPLCTGDQFAHEEYVAGTLSPPAPAHTQTQVEKKVYITGHLSSLVSSHPFCTSAQLGLAAQC